MKTNLFLLVTWWSVTMALGQTGRLDSAYGDNGLKVISPTVTPIDTIIKSYPAEDGGYFAMYYSGIAKYLKDGTIDVTYGKNGFVAFEDFSESAFVNTGSVRQEDGRITVVSSGVSEDVHLLRLKTDGSLDVFRTVESLELPFDFYYERVQSISLQKDHVVIAGTSSSYHPPAVFIFIQVLYPDQQGPLVDFSPGYRFFSDDSYIDDGDTKYYYEGWYTNPRPPVSAILQDNGIATLVGPDAYEENVYEADGTVIKEYTIPGGYTPPVFSDDAYTPAVVNTRPVELNAVENTITGNTDFLIKVFREDGSLDETFGNNGSIIVDFGGRDVPVAFAWEGDKLIVGGNSTDPNTGIQSFALVRLNPNGSLDRFFDGDGKQITYREGYNFNLVRLAIQEIGEKQRLLAVGDELIAAYILGDDRPIEEVTISCPGNKIVSAGEGTCSAIVNGLDPVLNPAGSTGLVNYTFAGATTGNGTGTSSGKTFNTGITDITYTLVGDPVQTCSFTVRVEDVQAPVISNLSSSISTLWPPNHKLVDVQIFYTLQDNCGASAKLSVSSNEPRFNNVTSSNDPDWVVVNDHLIRLRAERPVGEKERLYTVTVIAQDEAGNTSQKQLIITVPQSMGKPFRPGVAEKQEPLTKVPYGLKLRVLQNPTTNHFTLLIQSSRQEPFYLRVIDTQGRVVESQKKIGPGYVEIGSYYKPGLYYAELRQGEQVARIKLVKVGQ